MSFFLKYISADKTDNNNVSNVAGKIAGEVEIVLLVRIVKQAVGA